MANRTIDQSAPSFQERQKTLLRRIAHLDLLIGQINDEIMAIGDDMPVALKNHMKNLAMQLNNIKEDLAYLVNTQSDIEQQKQNEQLIIRRDEKGDA